MMDFVVINDTQNETAAPPKLSAAQKIRMLRARNEDFEWYPSTPEIIAAVEKDVIGYLKSHDNDHSVNYRNSRDKVRLIRDDDDNRKKVLHIESMLDIGAGDGRVLAHFTNAENKYGIEIATAQADDLIRKGIFLIGRNFWDVSLFEQHFGLVYCNPPYSEYAEWVNKILYECNFEILYLVVPVRWKNEKKITKELERYEVSVVGEFDFSEADRVARGKVNLIRVNAPWKKVAKQGGNEKCQATLEDAFERFVREHIADFEETTIDDDDDEYESQDVALKKEPIEQLVDGYEAERENLGAAFKAIGNLEPEIIKLMGQDKASMLTIIRKAIEGLKSKYWRAAFEKLEPVRERMTKKTRDRIFSEIRQFSKMDFNIDNIYSIVIWIINNSNIGILDQIGEVFDDLTDKEYIEAYKSNRHWVKSDWRSSKSSHYNSKYDRLPERWKIGLDYRIVTRAYVASYDRYSLIDDIIVICRNLGFPIAKDCIPDYKLHQEEQQFRTEKGELAFTMRYYTGNKNAHLKFNKKLLMKFNVEVAKIRRWISNPGDIEEEFDVTEAEAARLWNTGVALLGSSDVPMLEFKEEKEAV